MNPLKVLYFSLLFVVSIFWIWVNVVEGVNLEKLNNGGNVRDIFTWNSSLLGNANMSPAWSPTKYSFLNTNSYRNEEEENGYYNGENGYHNGYSPENLYNGETDDHQSNGRWGERSFEEDTETDVVADKLAEKINSTFLSYLENTSKAKEQNEKDISSRGEENRKFAEDVAEHLGKDVHEHINETILDRLKPYLSDEDYNALLKDMERKMKEVDKTGGVGFLLKKSEVKGQDSDSDADEDIARAVTDELVAEYLESDENPLEQIDKEVNLHDFYVDNLPEPENGD